MNNTQSTLPFPILPDDDKIDRLIDLMNTVSTLTPSDDLVRWNTWQIHIEWCLEWGDCKSLLPHYAPESGVSRTTDDAAGLKWQQKWTECQNRACAFVKMQIEITLLRRCGAGFTTVRQLLDAVKANKREKYAYEYASICEELDSLRLADCKDWREYQGRFWDLTTTMELIDPALKLPDRYVIQKFFNGMGEEYFHYKFNNRDETDLLKLHPPIVPEHTNAKSPSERSNRRLRKRKSRNRR